MRVHWPQTGQMPRATGESRVRKLLSRCGVLLATLGGKTIGKIAGFIFTPYNYFRGFQFLLSCRGIPMIFWLKMYFVATGLFALPGMDCNAQAARNILPTALGSQWRYGVWIW